MNRVVERCPNCGVEHDEAHGGACEVCGTALRYWCRVHGASAGWLDAPVCPRCEAEAAAPPPTPTPRPRTPAAAPPPRRRRTPAPVGERPPPGWTVGGPVDSPRPVPRAGTEELGPYMAVGAGLALRLVRALLAIVRGALLWGVLGGVAGGAFAYTQGGDPVWTAMLGLMIGGGLGVVFGSIGALRILAAPTRRRR